MNEIAFVCGYIADNQTIASYFNVPREHVEKVRASLSPPRKTHVGQERYPNDGTRNGSSGINSHILAEEDAIAGSRKLNEQTQKLFRKWEQKHGFREGAAEILLPAGYHP